MRWLAHRKWQIENKLDQILFKWLAYRQWKIGKTFNNNNFKKLAHRKWQIEFPGVPRHDEQEKCETI